MSSVYAPRRTLCVPDNACSLTMISTVIVVSSESEKLFSCVIIMSENVDVEEDFTLTSNVLRVYANRIFDKHKNLKFYQIH